MRAVYLEIGGDHLHRTLDQPRQNRTACVVDQILCIILLIVLPLNLCMKRNDNQSAPCAVIRSRHLRQVVRVQHQRMARFKGERCLELLFCKNGIGGTELFNHGGIQTHCFLQLCRNDKTFAFQFCHFRLDVTLAVDGQGIGGEIAGIAAQHLIDDIPEGRLAVLAVAIGNNHCFRVYFANQTETANHLHIVDQALVTAEEHLQSILPETATILVRNDRRHFCNQVSRIRRFPAVETFGEVISAAGCIQQQGSTVELFRVFQYQRLRGIECIVQAADIAVFHNEASVCVGKLKSAIGSKLLRIQFILELLSACNCK